MTDILSFIPKEPPNLSDLSKWVGDVKTVINNIFSAFGMPPFNSTESLVKSAATLANVYSVPEDLLQAIAKRCGCDFMSIVHMNDGSLVVYCIYAVPSSLQVCCCMNSNIYNSAKSPTNATIAVINMMPNNFVSVDQSWNPMVELFVKIAEQSREFAHADRVSVIPNAIDAIARNRRIDISSQMIEANPILYVDYDDMRHDVLQMLVKEYARDLLK